MQSGKVLQPIEPIAQILRLAMSSSHPALSLEVSTQPSIIISATADPSSIDKLLLTNILDPDLPAILGRSIAESADRCVTPELNWGGDPSRSASAQRGACITATLLGRAYALLAGDNIDSRGSYLGDLQEEDYIGEEWLNASGNEPDWQEPEPRQQKRELLRKKYTGPKRRDRRRRTYNGNEWPLSPFSMLPTELRLQIFQHYKDCLEQRRLLWSIISSTFIKALFSGHDPEPLARYCTGILVLTCGHALSQTKRLIGKGKHWTWWSDAIGQLEEFWTWSDLEQAIMQTKHLPRDTFDVPALMESEADWATTGDVPEYVPKEVLHVLDEARAHVQDGARDLNSVEIAAVWLPKLD